MRTIDIPKGNGKMRRIYIPSRAEAAASRAAMDIVADRAAKACPPNVVHGFCRHRSAVSNAQTHIGHAYTLTMDLRDFFDSVTAAKLKGKIPDDLLPAVLYDGAARQGLPSSPACANLAAAAIDHAVLKLIERRKLDAVYTRYADDLTISFDRAEIAEILLREMPQIVGRCGFALAPEKTHLYSAAAGRRIVTGVAVDDSIHPTRAARRRLRAARHQASRQVPGAAAAAAGLAEWCRLRPPRARVGGTSVLSDLDMMDQLRRLARAWQLGSIQAPPDKGPDVDIGAGCLITGDPVMMLGMSTWTTGWVSCMSQPGGARHRGVVYWMQLRGTRIAALMSDRSAVKHGVERRLMRARCLLHTLRNGVLVYDRMYGDRESCELLRGQLVTHGAISMDAARGKHRGEKVVGHAPARWHAWFDGLETSTATAREGRWKGKIVRVCHI